LKSQSVNVFFAPEVVKTLWEQGFHVLFVEARENITAIALQDVNNVMAMANLVMVCLVPDAEVRVFHLVKNNCINDKY
jgi:hypothetical protein